VGLCAAKNQLRVLAVNGIIIDRIELVAYMVLDFDCKKFVIIRSGKGQGVPRPLGPMKYSSGRTLDE
jgi:hypothetical protein